MSEETVKPKKKYYDYISVGNRTKQVVYFVEQHDKPVHFELYLQENPETQAIVIVKSKKAADELGKYLKDKTINAVVIHGNHRASQHLDAQNGFNAKEINILITTSKIYETLEFSDIKTIINYDLPFEPESYFKTLRAVDEIGESISFVNIADETMLETLEFMMKYEIPKEELESFTHTPLPKTDKSKKKKARHRKTKAKTKIDLDSKD